MGFERFDTGGVMERVKGVFPGGVMAVDRAERMMYFLIFLEGLICFKILSTFVDKSYR